VVKEVTKSDAKLYCLSRIDLVVVLVVAKVQWMLQNLKLLCPWRLRAIGATTFRWHYKKAYLGKR